MREYYSEQRSLLREEVIASAGHAAEDGVGSAIGSWIAEAYLDKEPATGFVEAVDGGVRPVPVCH